MFGSQGGLSGLFGMPSIEQQLAASQAAAPRYQPGMTAGQMMPQRLPMDNPFLMAFGVGAIGGSGRSFLHGSSGEISGALRPSERGAWGPGVYLTEQPGVAAKYGQNVTEHGVNGDLYQAYSASRGTLRLDPASEEKILSFLSDDDKAKVLSWKKWYGTDSEAFYEALSRNLLPDRVQAAFKKAGFAGIEGNRDGHEVVVFDPNNVYSR